MCRHPLIQKNKPKHASGNEEPIKHKTNEHKLKGTRDTN